MKDYVNKQVTLIKLSDDAFEGKHPNDIYAGNTYTGTTSEEVKIDQSVFINQNNEKLFYTSTVKKIVNETDNEIVFKTLNSTYKLSFVNESE